MSRWANNSGIVFLSFIFVGCVSSLGVKMAKEVITEDVADDVEQIQDDVETAKRTADRAEDEMNRELRRLRKSVDYSMSMAESASRKAVGNKIILDSFISELDRLKAEIRGIHGRLDELDKTVKNLDESEKNFLR